MEFVPRDIHLAVVSVLLTALLLGVAGVVFVYSWAVGKPRRARKALAAAVVIAGLYAVVLLAFSLTSREKTLAAGEWKYFCEVDCHVAYTVVSVTTAESLGPPTSPRPARGTFYVVRVRTWFDERTISSRRAKDMPLTPNPRVVAVVDDRGRSYPVSAAGQRAWEQAEGLTTPLRQSLRPGESYQTTLVFDLPVESRNPRFWLGDDPWLTWSFIGHENSFIHQRIFFQLEPAAPDTTTTAAKPQD